MAPAPVPPDYEGGSLVNLVAELEHRLTGSAPSNRLRLDLAAGIPDGESYVLVLFDGLGLEQLEHPRAAEIRSSLVAGIDAPFPSTTSVSLASIATGLAPGGHGLIGHHLMVDGTVFNSLKWRRLSGEAHAANPATFLPEPNLWERLAAAGREPLTVQAGNFADTPLSQAVYRGCRFEPVWNQAELVDAVVALAEVPGRLVLTYLPDVDFAAHLFGQSSSHYADALREIERVWVELTRRLGKHVVLVGTADHGHIDYSQQQKVFIRSRKGVAFYGDPRALYVRGDERALSALAEELPATRLTPEQVAALLGGVPDIDRLPDAAFLANPGSLLLPGSMDKRLIGYHGGLDSAEIRIPLLVRT